MKATLHSIEFKRLGGSWHVIIWRTEGKVLRYKVPHTYRLGYSWLEALS